MLPGKKYRPDDLLRIARRYKWLIVVPFVVVSTATLIGSRYLPNKYRSETLILVVPQRVPENYVRSTVTARIEDRLQSIQQQILSRTRLERIIQDFNLFSEERKTGIMEDIVERMRHGIHVDVVRGDAFRIAFTSDTPQTAQKVTERLATLFIDENLKDRENLAVGTNEFLEAQLEDARQTLVTHEKKLETYRLRHAGQLPSQVQSNLQAIQNVQVQIQNLVDANNRDRDRKGMLERLLADNDMAAVPPAVPQPAGESAELQGTSAQQLETAKNALLAMELRLKPEHPDIRRMKRTIATLERKVADEAAAATPAGNAAHASPQDTARVARAREMRAELDTLVRAIQTREAEEQRLRGISANYQTKVDVVPARESELAELTRDYETMNRIYQDLLAKKQDSQVAANLERRQIGEQFKVLDVARMPEKPFSPNRLLINVGGMAAGLALGLGLVFLLEYRDRSVRTVSDLALVVPLPVLAAVPMMLTQAELRRGRRRKLIAITSMAAIVTISAAVTAWKYRALIEAWVR